MPLFNSGITVPVPIAQGGTAATTEAGARTGLQLDNDFGWFRNIGLESATTTNSGDSIKITSSNGSAFSSTNIGFIRLPSHSTAGRTVEFSVTSDVTILLSGITPNIDGSGNLTGALLRILAVNDNGTLKWAVAYLGGRHTLLTTDTTATPASVTAPEYVLCNSTIGSANNTCREIGFIRADFTDSTNVWAIQTGLNDIRVGETADGLYQRWNPTFPGTGFSSNPTITIAEWTQIGRQIILHFEHNTDGSSNGTNFSISAPAKAAVFTGGETSRLSRTVDNGADVTTAGICNIPANSSTMTVYKTTAAATWTASGVKGTDLGKYYAVGPAASFIS